MFLIVCVISSPTSENVVSREPVLVIHAWSVQYFSMSALVPSNRHIWCRCGGCSLDSKLCAQSLSRPVPNRCCGNFNLRWISTVQRLCTTGVPWWKTSQTTVSCKFLSRLVKKLKHFLTSTTPLRKKLPSFVQLLLVFWLKMIAWKIWKVWTPLTMTLCHTL